MTQQREATSLTNTILLGVGLKGGTLCLTSITTFAPLVAFLHLAMKFAIGLGDLGLFLTGMVAFIKLADPSFRVHVAYRYWRSSFNRKKKNKFKN